MRVCLPQNRAFLPHLILFLNLKTGSFTTECTLSLNAQLHSDFVRYLRAIVMRSLCHFYFNLFPFSLIF